MSETKIILYNIKKFRGEHEFVLMFPMNAIIGKNRTGKSTVIQAFESVIRANGLVKVNKDESQGYVVYLGKDLNGNDIKIQMDVYKDKKETFKIHYYHLVEEKWKTVTDKKVIEELLGIYFPLTAQDVFYMIKTSEGRKRLIEDYLLETLSPKDKEELQLQQNSISSAKNKKTYNISEENHFPNKIKVITSSEKIGMNYYHQRTEINLEIKTLEKQIEDLILTNEEKEAIKNSEKDREVIIEIEEKISKSKNKIEQLASKNSDITFLREKGNLVMKQLQDLIESVSEVMGEFKDPLTTIKKEFYEKITKKGKMLAEEINFLKKESEENGLMQEELKKIRERNNNVIVSLEKKKNLETKTEQLKKLEECKKDLEDLINQCKQHITKIFKRSNLPEGLELTSDNQIILNEFEIDENITSESEMWIAIIELLCQLSKNKIVKIGDWSIFDQESKNEIGKIAEKHNKKFIGQLVVSDRDEPAIVNVVMDEEKVDEIREEPKEVNKEKKQDNKNKLGF